MTPPSSAPITLRLRRTFRLLGCLFAAGKTLSALNNGDQNARNTALSGIASRILSALDIRLTVSGRPDDNLLNSLPVVANHVSWLDIFAIGSSCPVGFIAKQEIRDWPFIGPMAKNAGTVFIDRTARKDVDSINRAISAALQSGQNICFFPEAKTSSGLEILPFKAALFQSAPDSGRPVLPLALRYYDSEGRRTELPSYVGNTSLLTSFLRIVSMKQLEIKLDFLPFIAPQGDRFEIKDTAEKAIGKIVLSDIAPSA